MYRMDGEEREKVLLSALEKWEEEVCSGDYSNCSPGSHFVEIQPTFIMKRNIEHGQDFEFEVNLSAHLHFH